MKKYLLGIFAIILAIGFSAFKSVKLATNQFYQFTSSADFLPGTLDSSPLDNASNWNTTALPSNPIVCNASTNLCAIEVVTPTGKTPPSFSTVVTLLRQEYDLTQSFNMPIIVTVGGVEQYRISQVTLKN